MAELPVASSFPSGLKTTGTQSVYHFFMWQCGNHPMRFHFPEFHRVVGEHERHQPGIRTEFRDRVLRVPGQVFPREAAHWLGEQP